MLFEKIISMNTKVILENIKLKCINFSNLTDVNNIVSLYLKRLKVHEVAIGLKDLSGTVMILSKIFQFQVFQLSILAPTHTM